MSGAGGDGAPRQDKPFDLIITIVPQGRAEAVIEASRAAGAEGGTILLGRGTGVRERKKILGMWIEPEKEVVLTLVPAELSEKVLNAVVEATDLNEPGRGVAFVVDVKTVTGISHLQLD